MLRAATQASATPELSPRAPNGAKTWPASPASRTRAVESTKTSAIAWRNTYVETQVTRSLYFGGITFDNQLRTPSDELNASGSSPLRHCKSTRQWPANGTNSTLRKPTHG